MIWTQEKTALLVELVDSTDDPVVGACAVIGAMVGVLIHHDGVGIADQVLRDFSSDIEIRIRRPQSANSPERV